MPIERIQMSTNEPALESTLLVITPLSSTQDYIIQREKRGATNSYTYKLLTADTTPVLVGYTKSSLFSSKYTIIDPLIGTPHVMIKSDLKRLRYSVFGSNCQFSVEYQDNFLGLSGSRSFTVTYDDGHRFVSKPSAFINGHYYLDFHDLDTTESVKNFICVHPRNHSQEFCLLTKNSRGTFTLRVNPPFSILHGFALALTTFHTGLYHR
jgi:hypothetical protein